MLPPDYEDVQRMPESTIIPLVTNMAEIPEISVDVTERSFSKYISVFHHLGSLNLSLSNLLESHESEIYFSTSNNLPGLLDKYL